MTQFDDVIVGAGPAGCLLANRLSADPGVEVLLIEAGERLGNPGRGWDDMLPAFTAIEDNELGASGLRGAGGPLQVSTVDEPDPLLDDVITAGTKLGWRQVRDLNESDEERIGYTMATIRRGRRCSAADAFLHPVRDRPT